MNPPEGEEHPRRRRHRLLLIASILALLAYPVLGTLALWTGFVEWLLRSEDIEVHIDNPAWTIWPGHISIDGVRVLVNTDTQFILEADSVEAQISMFDLLRRRFHVTELNADHVTYQMRVQVKKTEGNEQRVNAFPPLEGLPGDATVDARKAEKSEEPEKGWIVDIDGIDVSVRELWFLEYRYLGDGRLRGGFLVGPNQMEVRTSVQDLGPGQLRFGRDQVIAENFTGQIRADIPKLNPKEHADEGFFDFVTASIHLAGDVQSLRHVGAYLKGMTVQEGSGRFDANLRLDRGHLGRESTIRFKTEKVRLLGKGFATETDWDLDMRFVAGNGGKQLPRLRSSANDSYFSLTGRGREAFTLRARDHEMSAVLRSDDLTKLKELESARVRLPVIETRDLDDLDALGKGQKRTWQSKGGTAAASLDLRMREQGVFEGPLRAQWKGLKMVIADVNVGGNGEFQTRVRIDLAPPVITLSKVWLKLEDVLMAVGDEHVEDWWIVLATERLQGWGLPPTRVESDFTIRARDAEPLLESLAEKDKINDLIAKLTSLDDLRIKGDLRTRKGRFDLMLESVKSEVFDMSGRIMAEGDKSRFAMVIGGEAISLGIASVGQGTEVKPFAKEDWLNQRLRSFPRPLERVDVDAP